MTKFKLCIFGDSGVGKTSYCRKYLTNVFNEEERMTIGTDLHTTSLEVEGKTVGLQIWDFAGEEHYKILFPSFVQDAKGGLFMFDTTDTKSLDKINEWLDFFKDPNNREEFMAPIIMVGTKIDLEDKREVESDEVIELAKKKKLLGYIECSSKTGENVQVIMEAITKIMMKNAKLL
ncbi:MAG: Rab family GTPase [Promethearchaeota archaeon]